MASGALHLSPGEGWPVARLTGEVDLTNVDALGERLEGAVSNRSDGLVLDLTGVTYLDSTGLRLLFRLARRLGDRQQGLRLVVPTSSRLVRVLSIAGVRSVAQVYPTLDEAVLVGAADRPTVDEQEGT